MDQRLLRDIANSRTSTLRFLRPTFIRADGLHRFSRRCDDLESAARRACAFIRIGMTSPRRHRARSRAPAVDGPQERASRPAPSPTARGLSRSSLMRWIRRDEAPRAYGETPSMAKERNLAYLSPICRAALYSAELRQALTASRLSNWLMATRVPGDGPSSTVKFCPAARSRPPDPFIEAWTTGTYCFWYASKSEMSVW